MSLVSLLILVIGGGLCPRRALGIGEVTGRIGGVVLVDATGDGLSGVQLSVRSKDLIGGAQQAVTDNDGSYIFQNLPPGTYELTANIEGFAPVLQKNITVNAGQLAPVDIRLQLQTAPQQNQTYQIIEKTNPRLNTESAVAVTTFTNQELTSAPTLRQTHGVSQLTPGVTQGTNLVSVRGGLGRSNKFLVDGLDSTDIVQGGYNAQINFDVVEQNQYFVGSMDAEYNSLGAVQNVVTRSGGNKLTVDATVVLLPAFLGASTRYAANSPEHDANLLYDTRPRPERVFYSGNLNIGGPIVKDRLWFYTSFQFNYNRNSNAEPAAPWYGNSTYDRHQDFYVYLGRAKLTWQATASTRLAIAFGLERYYVRNTELSTTLLPEAERRRDRRSESVVLLWDTLITPKLLFQMQAGFTTKRELYDTIRHDADNPDPDHLDAPHTLRTQDAFNGYSYLNSPLPWNDENKLSVQAAPSLLYTAFGLGGTHNIKGGVQFAYQRYGHNVGVPGGAAYTDNVAGLPCDPQNPLTFSSCNQVVLYPESAPSGQTPGAGFSTVADVFTLGLYLQDRYTLKRWLTLVPGFRFDAGWMRALNTDNRVTLLGYGPRLSIVYDLLHDRTTLIEAHYGRHNDVGSAFIADRGNPTQTGILERWDPTTQSFQKINTSGGLLGTRFADQVTAPHLDEVSVGIHREVISQAVIGVDYTYRKYSNLWVNQEVNQVWDPAGTRVVGYQNGVRQAILEAATPDGAQRRYHGVDLWIKGAPGNFDLTASYTLAFTSGTVIDYFETNGYGYNPRLNNLFDGNLPDNYRHYFKALLDYRFPFGLTLGTRFQYLNGAPQWKVFQSPQDNSFSLYRSPRGSDTGTRVNDPTTWAGFGLPDQVVVDVQLGYNLQWLTGQNIDVNCLFFNTLNLGTPIRIDNRDGPNFGTATQRLDPFFAEFILRYRY